MPIDPEIFESLGANCEFGFFLSRCGHESGSAFRWTEIPAPEALVSVLNANLNGMFEFDNIRPFNENMVLDSATGIGWHSLIKSRQVLLDQQRIPENFEFIAEVHERRELWSQQASKIKYLCNKTRTSLSANDKIFVYKPLWANRNFDLDTAAQISAALKRRGSSKFLVVTVAARGDIAGSVKQVSEGLVHGFIDRFAPGSDARNISFDCWQKICMQAAAILGVSSIPAA